MPTEFWLESLRGRHHSKGLCIDEKIILKWIRIGTLARLLWTQ
jgi:hypothetical protein